MNRWIIMRQLKYFLLTSIDLLHKQMSKFGREESSVSPNMFFRILVLQDLNGCHFLRVPWLGNIRLNKVRHFVLIPSYIAGFFQSFETLTWIVSLLEREYERQYFSNLLDRATFFCSEQDIARNQNSIRLYISLLNRYWIIYSNGI